MSALARFFLHEKKEVSGSDKVLSNVTEALVKEGVKVHEEHSAENITDDVDLVVYTEAVNPSTEGYVELEAAKQKGIMTMSYFKALGQVANEYYLIAVAGTHGKTTTTAMLTDILEEADLDPTAIIGSLRSKTGSNYRAGKTKYAIVEACEYKRDFLFLTPDVLVITNLEFEHVDYYVDLADVQSAFRELALKVSDSGAIIAEVENPNIAPVLEGVEAKVIDYKTKLDLGLKLHQPGIHNRMNAAAASAAAAHVGVPKDTINKALENFAGTWRRFEYKGTFTNGQGKVPVYDDYGHHPTEISATITATKEMYAKHHVVVVFQPHTYSRTVKLLSNFASALAKADQVILLPIHAAREENTTGITSVELVTAVTEKGGNAVARKTVEEAVKYVKENTPSSSVVITMGAGSLTTEVAEGLVENVA